MVKIKQKIEVAPVVTLKGALHWAHEALDKGEDLPAYLGDALKRYSKARWKQIDARVLVPKEVERARAGGAPKGRNTHKPKSAFKVAGERLGMSESTVERRYLEAKRKSRPEQE